MLVIPQYIMQQTNIHDQSLQETVNAAIKWSKPNSMKINTTKLKEMLISYARENATVLHITIDDEDIERVNTCTLLGVIPNEYLTGHNHTDQVYIKACQDYILLCS